MNRIISGALVAMVGLVAGCGGGGGGGINDVAVVQPKSCADAAASVAANKPASVTTLRITKAEDQVASGTVKAHCLVEGSMNERVSPVDGQPYALKFRMRLPLAADWNGKFFQESVGGSVGTLTSVFGLTPGMTTSAFSRGYTVIMGDSGHDSAINTDPNAGGPSSFGRDPQARIDFGYASYDLVAQVGKAISNAYYAKPSSRSYFSACSDGGRQAVGIAQRYPQHFDGIIAGAPAVDIPHMTAYVPHLLQTLAPLAIAAGQVDANGRPLINKVYSNGDLQLVSNAVLEACDSLDGLKDGIANNIDACTDAVVMPKLTALTCQGPKNDSCLTAAQISALQKSMAGPRTSTGVQVYPGHHWDPGIGGMLGTAFNSGFRTYWFGTYDSPTNTATKLTLSAPQAAMLWKTPPTPMPIPEYIDYFLTYNIDDTEASITRKTDVYKQSVVEWGLMNSPDLSGFKQRGGKMISWIGNADAAVSPQGTIDWYNSVNTREGGKAADFLRLFVIPGMNHCGGGWRPTGSTCWSRSRTGSSAVLRPKAFWPRRATLGISTSRAARGRCARIRSTRITTNNAGDINDASNFACR